jgi:hypothetical protein
MQKREDSNIFCLITKIQVIILAESEPINSLKMWQSQQIYELKILFMMKIGAV